MRSATTNQTRFIAIVGGSGAGKTWFAERLLQALHPKASGFSLDQYYIDRSRLSPARRRRVNFDHPRTIDWKSFETTLKTCSKGSSASVPIYDFATHARSMKTSRLTARPWVIVDGLWLLRRPSIRRFFQHRIFIDCPSSLRLTRRLTRDRAERMRDAADIQHQFRSTVQPMHRRFVDSQRRWATVVLKQPLTEKIIRDFAKKLTHGTAVQKGRELGKASQILSVI